MDQFASSWFICITLPRVKVSVIEPSYAVKRGNG